jgi:hypothetical protein
LFTIKTSTQKSVESVSIFNKKMTRSYKRQRIEPESITHKMFYHLSRDAQDKMKNNVMLTNIRNKTKISIG